MYLQYTVLQLRCDAGHIKKLSGLNAARPDLGCQFFCKTELYFVALL